MSARYCLRVFFKRTGTHFARKRFREAFMRGIPLILASAIVVTGFAVATAGEPAATAPIKLVVFPFELVDFSAAAASTPPDDVDREQLRLSTDEARRLIAASARYTLIDPGAVNDEAAKAGKLRVRIAAAVAQRAETAIQP